MSVFGSIMGAIFGHGSAQASAPPTAASGATPAQTAAPSAAPAQTVDVAAIVDKAAAAKGEKLDWRTSIVDLMKALNLDSSLTARKELAKELNYTGDTNDLGYYECLAAQADHGEARRQWRQTTKRYRRFCYSLAVSHVVRKNDDG